VASGMYRIAKVSIAIAKPRLINPLQKPRKIDFVLQILGVSNYTLYQK
jgi:hypothetical protein